MAIAGKVAITPKGDWNNIETYDKLDLVKYNNSLYIAKKSNQNIIPEDGDIWMLAVKSYDEEEFNKLITDVDDINRNLGNNASTNVWNNKRLYNISNYAASSAGPDYVETDIICKPNTTYHWTCSYSSIIKNEWVFLEGTSREWLNNDTIHSTSANVTSGDDGIIKLVLTKPHFTDWFNALQNASLTLGENSEQTEYGGDSNIILTEEVDNINESLDDLEYSDIAGGKNIANPYNFEDGKVVDYNSGAISDNSLYFVTGYIDVEPSTKYTKQGFSSTGENWYYDENKNPISMITSDTFTTPSNAKYVVLSALIRNKNICMLEKGSKATTYEPYIPSVKMLASEVAAQKNDLDKLNSLPKGSIIQIDADKDDIETTTQKYGWQYLGTSNIQYENGSLNILVTNVYRKNN